MVTGEEWTAVVTGGNADTFYRLISSVIGEPKASKLLRESLALASNGTEGLTDVPKFDGGKAGEVATPSAEKTLYVVQGVQCIHPRGRFDLEFKEGVLALRGKSITVTVSWTNLRHILR
ncbi:unnamed protein product, partial [Discosporangium mesarthrocarpum]